MARDEFSRHAAAKMAESPPTPAVEAYFDTLDRQLEAEIREAWVEVVPEPEDQGL